MIKNKKIIYLSILLIASASIFFVYSLLSGGGKQQIIKPSSSESMLSSIPTDGSLPQDYESMQNIKYVLGAFSTAKSYRSNLVGTVTAKAGVTVTQKVNTFRDYKDGILIVGTISKTDSSFSTSSAIQKFFGKNSVVIRNAKSKNKNDWNGKSTEWSQTVSEIIDNESYKERYGLLASSLMEYVITEDTVLDVSETVKEGENYILSFKLDPEKSTYYYRKQMLTMGVLDDYPKFKSIAVTFTFDKDWKIQSVKYVENYDSKKFITANCSTDMLMTFNYDESSIDVSDYANFFNQYSQSENIEKVEELEVIDVLTAGFGDVINGYKFINLDLNAFDKTINAKAKINLDIAQSKLNSLNIKLENIEFAFKDDVVYVKYNGNYYSLKISDLMSFIDNQNFKINLPLDKINDIIKKLKLKDSLKKYVSLFEQLKTIDVNGLLDKFLSYDLLENDGKVVISGNLDIAQYINLKYELNFTKQDKNISFENANLLLNTSIFGEINVNLSLTDEDIFDNFVNDSVVDVKPFLEYVDRALTPIKNSISNEKWCFDLSLVTQLNGKDLGVLVKGNIENQVVNLNAQIQVDGGNLPLINLSVEENNIVLSVGEYYAVCSKEELSSLINKLVGETGINVEDIFEKAKQILSNLDTINLIKTFAKTFKVDIIDQDNAKFTYNDIIIDTFANGKETIITVNGLDNVSLKVGLYNDLEIEKVDTKELKLCDNLVEFLFNAVAQITNNNFEAIVNFEDGKMAVDVNCLINLISNDDNSVTINFDGKIVIVEKDKESVKHVINVTAFNDTLYVDYTNLGDKSTNPLRVSLPISELISGGKNAFNSLCVILNINLDTKIVTLINEILSNYSNCINSNLFSCINKENVYLIFKDLISNFSVDSSFDLSLLNIERVDNDLNLQVEKDGLSILVKTYGKQIEKPTESYIDGTGLSTLLEDLQSTLKYANADKGYYLEGSLDIDLVGINLTGIKAKANVSLDEQNERYVEIILDIDGYKNVLAKLLIGSSVIINGDTQTKITLYKDLVTIERTQKTYFSTISEKTCGKPVVVCRAMTLDYFTKDLINQLFFAINVSDEMNSYVNKKINSSEESSQDTVDVGDYVTSYSFKDNKYTVGVALDKIIGSKLFKPAEVAVTRAMVNNSYELSNISGKLSIFGLINVNFSFDNKSSQIKTSYITEYNEQLAKVYSYLGFKDIEELYNYLLINEKIEKN